MANLDPRTDSFISLLVEVSGRARPEDINSVSSAEAAALLEAYALAHPEKGLAFDGQTLSYAAVAPPQSAAAPAETVESASVAVPAAEPVASAWDLPKAAPAEVAPAASVPDASELPAWVFEGSAAAQALPESAPNFEPAPSFEPTPGFEPAPSFEPAPIAEPQPAPTFEPAPRFEPAPTYEVPQYPAAPAEHEAVFSQPPTGGFDPAPSAPAPVPPVPAAEYGVPQLPAQGGYYGVADAAPPEYVGGESADYAPAGDFVPQSSTATMDYLMQTPVGPAPVPTRINGLWWLAVLFFGAPGAFVAWFLNRDRTGAKTFLWVAIGLVVLAVLAVAALFALGFFATAALQTGP